MTRMLLLLAALASPTTTEDTLLQDQGQFLILAPADARLLTDVNNFQPEP